MNGLGEITERKIERLRSVGAYLEGDILLPKKELTDRDTVGSYVTVFIYNDAKGRPIATKRKPHLLPGEVGKMRVVELSRIGAFLDWGLDKDLLLPFHEQTYRPKKGEDVFVAVYLDRSERFCATMKVREHLSRTHHYAEGDTVEGTVYSLHKEYGAFVAVDNKYEARISKQELYGVFSIGERIDARVLKVHPDGRMDLSVRELSHLAIDDNAQLVLSALEENGGFLPFDDRSDPERIRDFFSMSKSDYKKAIGRLYREKRITFRNGGVELERSQS